MCPFVKLVQRKLVPYGDGPDERHPVLLGHAKLRFVAIEQIAERPRLGFAQLRLFPHD